MDRRERHALLVVLSLAAGGHLLRAIGHPAAGDPLPAALRDSVDLIDPGARLALIDSLSRPLKPGDRIDADRASAAELQRLPGIGAVTARRIVADRDSVGRFGSLAALGRVRGIGPATLKSLAPWLTFSGPPAEALGGDHQAQISLNHAGQSSFESLPGIGATRAAAIVAFRDSAGPFRQIADLARVRGISAALVKRLAGRLRLD